MRTKPSNTVFNNWGTPMAGDTLHKNFQELQKWERGKQRHKRECCEGEALGRLWKGCREQYAPVGSPTLLMCFSSQKQPELWILFEKLKFHALSLAGLCSALSSFTIP